ncbi:MAG: hypothetical protein BHW64_00410 [Candidatus Melainabacteria bacterium LEY3_CP_29_8]|nr:MAG: hypothetical protein BHW64_00410 [Candidatus Melainabacteria bacterium LEY3_CP_29_8]
MTINIQQVNNPFVLDQIGGSYNLGVSVGEIEELYELLGYTESEDMASQLISTAGFGMLGAVPEVVKSVKYKDDVRFAYDIAKNTKSNIFERMCMSNNFEDLLITETKAHNKAVIDGINETKQGKWYTRLFKIVRRDGSNNTNQGQVVTNANKAGFKSQTSTNAATEGRLHQALGTTIEVDTNGKRTCKTILTGKTPTTVTTATAPATPAVSTAIPATSVSVTENLNIAGNDINVTVANGTYEGNTKCVVQRIATGSGANQTTVDAMENFDSIAKNLNTDELAKNALPSEIKNATNMQRAVSSSISNAKACSKSITKEAFGGWGIALTTINGLLSELPEITTAFKSSSNEGWAQLGRSLGTIAISDIGLSAVGQILGGTLGFALGGFIGPVGASIGSAIGKAVGSSLGSFLGRKLSSLVFGKSASEQQKEEQVSQQAKATASSQINLQTLLSQAKEQAAAETDSNKANKILAQVQAIENKLLNTSLTTTQSTYTNPFVTV